MALKRLVIHLTDDEYAALEAEALRERRTVRQQAEFRVTRDLSSVALPVKTVTAEPDWMGMIAKGGPIDSPPGGTLVQ